MKKQFPTEWKTFRVPIEALTPKELHDCLVEEASEVIKALCKAKRFGFWSNIEALCFEQDKAPYHNNARDVLSEFDQLHALMNELRKRLNIEPGPTSGSILVLRETM